MMEFCIQANSFAAPFVSDTSEAFVEAETAEQALAAYVESYSHPAGLYSAIVWDSADSMMKGKPALAKWVCNQVIKIQELTKDLSGYTFRGDGPGAFEINGTRYETEDPQGGKVVSGDWK